MSPCTTQLTLSVCQDVKMPHLGQQRPLNPRRPDAGHASNLVGLRLPLGFASLNPTYFIPVQCHKWLTLDFHLPYSTLWNQQESNAISQIKNTGGNLLFYGGDVSAE